jgi:hypothetical protein
MCEEIWCTEKGMPDHPYEGGKSGKKLPFGQ